jgi:RNA polymerase sigma factor (sigma-70 family)
VLRALAQRWQPRAVTADDPRLRALRAGEAHAIEAVLHELLPAVRRWVHYRVGPDPALDDIAQEALTEIARALPSFEGHGSLNGFAYRICARVTVRQLRRKRSRVDLPARETLADDGASDTLDPERCAIEREALRAVLACLQRLPARRREAFILCELEGETPQSAAELLGTTPAAVRSRLMHTRRELERRLRGHDLLDRLRGRP